MATNTFPLPFLLNFASPTFWVGFLCIVIGSFMEQIGKAMLKYAHLKNSQLKIEYRRIYFLNINWITVFMLFAVGFLFQIISLSFTYFILLIPFISIFVMLSVFYTFRYEAQKITDTDKIFFILCCLYLFLMNLYFFYSFFQVICSFVCLIVSGKVDSQRGEIGLDVILMKFTPFTLGFFLITLFGFFSLFFTAISFLKRFQNAIICGSAPAFLQILGLIFSKISIDLILKSIYSHYNQFEFISTYIIIIFAIFCNVLSMHMLQVAFIHFEHRLYKFVSYFCIYDYFIFIAIIVMIFHLVFSFSSVIASLFMFDEFEEMHLFQTILFLLCIIIQLFSIYSTVKFHATRASLYPIQQQTHEGSLVVISELEFENEMNDDAAQNKEQAEQQEDEDDFQEAQDIEERMP